MQRSHAVMMLGSSEDDHCAKRARLDLDTLRRLDCYLFPPVRFQRQHADSIVGADALLQRVLDAPSIRFTSTQFNAWSAINDAGGFSSAHEEDDALRVDCSGAGSVCSRASFAVALMHFLLPNSRDRHFQTLGDMPFALVNAFMFFQAAGETAYSVRDLLLHKFFEQPFSQELLFWSTRAFSSLQTPEMLRFMLMEDVVQEVRAIKLACSLHDEHWRRAQSAACFDLAASSGVSVSSYQRNIPRLLGALIRHLFVCFYTRDADALAMPAECWGAAERLVQPFVAFLLGSTDAPTVAMLRNLPRARLRFLGDVAADAHSFISGSGGSVELQAAVARTDNFDALYADAANAVLRDTHELAVAASYAPAYEEDLEAHRVWLRDNAQVLDARALDAFGPDAALLLLRFPASVRAARVLWTVQFVRALIANATARLGAIALEPVHVSFVDRRVRLATTRRTLHLMRAAMLCHALKSTAPLRKTAALWPVLTMLYAGDDGGAALSSYATVQVLAHWLGVRSSAVFRADGVPVLGAAATHLLLNHLHSVVELLWPDDDDGPALVCTQRFTAVRNFLLLSRHHTVRAVALVRLVEALGSAHTAEAAVLAAVLLENGLAPHEHVPENTVVPLTLLPHTLDTLLGAPYCSAQTPANETVNSLFYAAALSVGGDVGRAALLGADTNQRYAPPRRTLYHCTPGVVTNCADSDLAAGVPLRSAVSGTAKLARFIRALELSVCTASSSSSSARLGGRRAERARPQHACELEVARYTGVMTLHWADSLSLVDPPTTNRALEEERTQFSDTPVADACLSIVAVLHAQCDWSAAPLQQQPPPLNATLNACDYAELDKTD